MFKPCSHILSNIQNPNTIFKISIYNTKLPQQCLNTFEKHFGEIPSKNETLQRNNIHNIYKLQKSYFVNFEYFVDFVYLDQRESGMPADCKHLPRTTSSQWPCPSTQRPFPQLPVPLLNSTPPSA